MNTIDDILNVCDAAIFYDYKNIGHIDEWNHARNYVISNSRELILVGKVLAAPSAIDVINLKINAFEVENIDENICGLISEILGIITFWWWKRKIWRD